MTTIEEIQQSIAPELQALNTRIERQLVSSNELLNTIVRDYLKKKGKQIRPIIVLLSAGMFGEVTPRVIAGAAAVELLHNSSLIHDDVVDESRMRRGVPSINSVWDNHIAVLVGDFFVSVALQEAISTGDIRIVETLSNLGKLLSLGELDQIYNARYHTLTEDAYFEIISRKTASLFVACARVGCFAIGVDDERMDTLSSFAHLLGLAFQIKDDIFDYMASDKQIGKPVGNDLREGKITLPLLYAITMADAPLKEQMAELSRKETLTDEEIQALTDYAIAAGGIDYAYAKMESLRKEAAEIMATLPPSEYTRDFMALFDYIIERCS